MAEDLAAGGGLESHSIFDFDIPCPHCEYNLRGLTVPRCPECGNGFDPHKVLHDFREMQPPLPILWVIRNIYGHPLSFWEMPEVRRSRGPLRVQLFFVLLYAPVVLTYVCEMMTSSAGRWYRSHPGMFIVTALFSMLLVSLFPYMFVLIHGILCRIGLARCTVREGVRAAKEVVGYGLVWFGPVLLGFIAATRYVPSLFTAGGAIGEQFMAIAVVCAIVAFCAAWAATIYQGARFVSGGSGAVAVWCTLANPFWYILALVGTVAILSLA